MTVKDDVIARLKAGEKPSALAKEFNLHPTTVYKYKYLMQGKKPRRKVAKVAKVVAKPTNHSDSKMVAELMKEVEFWKNKFLEEIRKK